MFCRTVVSFLFQISLPLSSFVVCDKWNVHTFQANIVFFIVFFSFQASVDSSIGGNLFSFFLFQVSTTSCGRMACCGWSVDILQVRQMFSSVYFLVRLLCLIIRGPLLNFFPRKSFLVWCVVGGLWTFSLFLRVISG